MRASSRLDQTEHGTRHFPAECYFVDSRHPRYEMSFHWHSEWEFIQILRGSMQVFLGEESYRAQAGDVLLIRGGIIHGAVPENCEYVCFVFDLYGLFRSMDMVKEYLRPFYRQTVLPQSYFPAEETTLLHAQMQELISAFREEKQDCPQLDTIGCLCKIFSWLLKSNRYTSNTGEATAFIRRIDRIKSVLEYIEVNFASEITLEKLAEIGDMNQKYFCRVFSAITHQSPMDYVNFYRVEQAAQLLVSTEQPITAIGLSCGFWESSYFTKVFKKYKGITPKKYRQAARE